MALSFLRRFQALATPVGTEAQRNEAAATIKAVCQTLPELLAVAVIDIETGKALAAHSNVPGMLPAKAAPYNAEVVRQKRQALRALSLPDERIEDILITMREQSHLLCISQDDQRLLFLAVNTQDTNMALARSVLRMHFE
ncbi:hypothetical protein QMK33_22420 [Hymenobacter sp. H14-R3]|uniref:hypothetical protein n=1 Tax=Hymenobacter sp. H14-R3 TaxID=3046308 RepID=UPI0024BB298C|nr:hypothetical protein [Hymenobacter sp. H14-R3]MDJ0367907.1 hypothetical protein [Hymenobacter sp. H14-R3]